VGVDPDLSVVGHAGAGDALLGAALLDLLAR
jgi:hypothetical protein